MLFIPLNPLKTVLELINEFFSELLRNKKYLRQEKKAILRGPLYMFSQRNNPYCDLLQIVSTKIINFRYYNFFLYLSIKIITMKRILGLDLGTNSIGWALMETTTESKFEKTVFENAQIQGLGSRIIPMPQNEIDDFSRGITKSATADRTDKRGTRRLYERSNLRRERMHRVLNILGFLPEHYENDIATETKKERRNAGLFRKNLMKDGFSMFQFSIYMRHCNSRENMDVHIKRVKSFLPPDGFVAIMQITDKQFGMIELFHGKSGQKIPEMPQQLTLF
jgi:CRISPR-associated protein Cas2